MRSVVRQRCISRQSLMLNKVKHLSTLTAAVCTCNTALTVCIYVLVQSAYLSAVRQNTHKYYYYSYSFNQSFFYYCNAIVTISTSAATMFLSLANTLVNMSKQVTTHPCACVKSDTLKHGLQHEPQR
jgi:hypothetical protein